MDETTALAARLGSYPRSAVEKTLTADNTVRSLVLSGGGYRLYGSSTQVYYGMRHADDAAGTSTDAAAPTLPAPVAGAPGAGLAWSAAGGSVDGALSLPTSATDYVELAVPTGKFFTLYLRAGSATTVKLQGPFQ